MAFHSAGEDARAVEVVHEVARRNGKTTTLALEDLQACESLGSGHVDTSAAAALARNLKKLNLTHVRALFSTRRLGFSTGA